MTAMLQLTRGLQRIGVPDRLVIADGTQYRTSVLDCRSMGPWSEESRVSMDKPRLIVYHHTASTPSRLHMVGQQLDRLRMEASRAPFGLPYNFLIWPARPFRIFYLNDIDHAWPHTYGFNYATAIAALGNYEVDEPPEGLAERMTDLADALATMWGQYVPETTHRDVYPTACPGQFLYPKLRAIIEAERQTL